MARMGSRWLAPQSAALLITNKAFRLDGEDQSHLLES